MSNIYLDAISRSFMRFEMLFFLFFLIFAFFQGVKLHAAKNLAKTTWPKIAKNGQVM